MLSSLPTQSILGFQDSFHKGKTSPPCEKPPNLMSFPKTPIPVPEQDPHGIEVTPHRDSSAAQPDSHPQPHLRDSCPRIALIFHAHRQQLAPSTHSLRAHGASQPRLEPGYPTKKQLRGALGREKLLSRAPSQQSHRQSRARRTSWEHFAEHTVIPTLSSYPWSHAADRGCGEDYHVKSNENKKYRQENYNILKGSFRIIKIIPLLRSLFLKTPNQTVLSVLNLFFSSRHRGWVMQKSLVSGFLFKSTSRVMSIRKL